jgi:Flp pilus assembly protein TadG
MKISTNRKGNAMLEFALGATILFAAFAGTFQYGYTFYQYNLLEHAVNQGARYASMRPYDSTTATPTDTFKTAVKNMVVYGNPTGGTTAVVRNLTTANVNVSATFSSGIPSTVTVSVTNFTVNAIFGTTTFNKPTATYPYTGIWSAF